jgi:thiol-disulfide isomerase/thioredoxin
MKNKLIILGLTLLFTSLNISAQSGWNNNYKQALKLSKALNKPILVDFMASWCGPCKMMDRDVWSKEDIAVLKNNYIPLKIDIDLYSDVANKYRVKSIPNIMILDSYGNTLFTSLGYKRKQEVAKFLSEYAVNLTGINRAMFILERSKQNVYSNIRVGQKYQDASLVLKGNVRKSFLKMSNQYFKKAEKIKDTKPNISEKIGLLILLNKAYYYQNKSILKAIQKKYKKVEDVNKPLLTYIKLYVYNNLHKDNETTALLSELKHMSNASTYLEKANFVLKKN